MTHSNAARFLPSRRCARRERRRPCRLRTPLPCLYTKQISFSLIISELCAHRNRLKNRFQCKI
ncbi:hypothetical protein TSAR_000834 [Trichomalopsis sarcophagae]|uniref:Uncharacterized protein n=1 Tax=Trichomalopsis sarcophagae TaxID=543379 RepID=A0A232EJ47_9HYME|nr:hypothetical protein TSAR_000834 [Trichomalopsis sarcophagae]